jgi:hypothetical protein
MNGYDVSNVDAVGWRRACECEWRSGKEGMKIDMEGVERERGY